MNLCGEFFFFSDRWRHQCYYAMMMIVVNAEADDDIVAADDIAAAGAAGVLAVVSEIDTLSVVVQTGIAQVAQVQTIEVVNGDL